MLKTYIACTDELENSMLFFSLYSAMPQYRRDKINRMVFPKDKRLSLGVGALLDYALTLDGVSDREIIYVQNQKPCLKNSNIRFNLSHSGNMVFCAVSDTDVGCDVEQITDIDMKIAARFFFHEEYEAISACPDNTSRNDLFFRYWTLKESFMKVTGLGFKLQPDDFCKIQRACGEEYLSKTCRTYPRLFTHLAENLVEETLTLSCPVAARCCLLNREPLRFEQIERDLSRMSVSYFNAGELLQPALLSMQGPALGILQRRIEERPDLRFVLLGFFLDRADELTQEEMDAIAENQAKERRAKS